MNVAIIAAIENHGGIGYRNRLPWSLPDDLRRFKRLTMGHPLILGRKTWESIGKVLPGRHMLIVTRQAIYNAPGCQVVRSLEEALKAAREVETDVCFIGGGASLFKQGLKLANRMYLTHVHADLPSDTFFPDFQPELWQETWSEFHETDIQHAYSFTYKDFVRLNA